MPRMSVGIGPFRFYGSRSVRSQARRNVAIKQEMRRIESGHANSTGWAVLGALVLIAVVIKFWYVVVPMGVVAVLWKRFVYRSMAPQGLPSAAQEAYRPAVGCSCGAPVQHPGHRRLS